VRREAAGPSADATPARKASRAIGFKAGKAALALNPSPTFGFTSAANPEMLPQPKPRAMPEHFVVPPIRSRDVAGA
jgi:hypothetical protein